MSATGAAELGHKPRKRRLEGDHGLKQTPHFAGIKPSTLSNYERGRRTPGVVVLKRLADFYGVRVAWLLSHLSRRETAA